MILADSSVWINHLARNNDVMQRLLNHERILLHPHVTGEIALGNLRNREDLLFRLNIIPKIVVASNEEVQILIENKRLYGLGVGYVDCHLIASVLLTNRAKLWTTDKRLCAVAQMLGVAM